MMYHKKMGEYRATGIRPFFFLEVRTFENGVYRKSPAWGLQRQY